MPYVLGHMEFLYLTLNRIWTNGVRPCTLPSVVLSIDRNLESHMYRCLLSLLCLPVVLMFVLLSSSIASAESAIKQYLRDHRTAELRIARGIETGTITVRDDTGGYISSYTRTVAGLPKTTQIRIAGDCRSACTLFLGHPGVCALPGARFIFHGPSRNGVPLSPEAFEATSREMARYYPEPLKSEFMSSYRYLIAKHKQKTIRGTSLVDAGIIRPC